MYRDETFYIQGRKCLEKLQGKWNNDCPFEFDQELFQNKNKVQKENNRKFKSVDGRLYASIERQNNLAIFKLYEGINSQLSQKISVRMNEECNYYNLTFTSDYFILISQNLLYYQNQNNEIHFDLKERSIVSLLCQQNQLHFVLSDWTKLQYYKIDQSLKVQLIRQVDFEYNIMDQSMDKNHHLGFFKREFDTIILISNQTLKAIRVYKKQGFNLETIYKKSKHCKSYFFLIKDILFLDIQIGQYTLMIQLRNGKIIRKIQHIDDIIWKHYFKQLFFNFLIICSQLTQYQNALDIYDFQKGQYVASILYEAKIGLDAVTITEDQVILPNGYGWKIKEKYLQN